MDQEKDVFSDQEALLKFSDATWKGMRVERKRESH